MWRGFGGLVCAQGEARGELQKVGIRARVVENKLQGAKGGSMGVESRKNTRSKGK